jgi:hypothetical protein
MAERESGEVEGSVAIPHSLPDLIAYSVAVLRYGLAVRNCVDSGRLLRLQDRQISNVRHAIETCTILSISAIQFQASFALLTSSSPSERERTDEPIAGKRGTSGLAFRTYKKHFPLTDAHRTNDSTTSAVSTTTLFSHLGLLPPSAFGLLTSPHSHSILTSRHHGR